MNPGVALRACFLMLVVVASDALTKALAESHLATAVGLPLEAQLALSYNRGVAFGALADAPALLTIGFAGVFLAIVVWAAARGHLPVSATALGLIGGGAVANVLDRLPDGRVTDFIDLPYWPSFNLADVAITAAVVLLLVSAGRPEAGRSNAPTGRRSR